MRAFKFYSALAADKDTRGAMEQEDRSYAEFEQIYLQRQEALLNELAQKDKVIADTEQQKDEERRLKEDACRRDEEERRQKEEERRLKEAAQAELAELRRRLQTPQ